jgi:uncharacterized protein YdcH (DUF465 family)
MSPKLREPIMFSVLSVTGMRRIRLVSIVLIAFATSSSGEQQMTLLVMISLAVNRLGFLPSATARQVMSRSVRKCNLSKRDHEFSQLTTQYDEVNRHIYRIESEDEPTSDEVLEDLKKWRFKIKDEIARVLTKLERRM